MDGKVVYKIVYKLIGEAKTEKALNILSDYLDGTECFETITLLKNRQKQIRNKLDSGIITHEEEILQLNKIAKSVLNLCNRIQEGECKPVSYIEQMKKLLNEINPEIIAQLKGGKKGVRTYINQDNFNQLLNIQSNLSGDIVRGSLKQKTTVISHDKLRSTVHLYDKKHGIALECIIFSHPDFLE